MNRPSRKPAAIPTERQIAQREIAWLLRITLGYKGNLGTALGQFQSLTPEAKARIGHYRDAVKVIEDDLRQMLKELIK